MSVNIRVSGSFNSVLAKLQRMKAVVGYRVSVGYRQFQHDEQYGYVTARDDIVCPRCYNENGQVWRGDYISDTFPYAAKVDEVTVDVHLHGRCRCKLVWLNKIEVLVERLRVELEAA